MAFIGQDPKFEAICTELGKYNAFTERTQEISSLEYFEFVRLDCESVRRGLGDAARKLSNMLLQNVVDTYRKENSRICQVTSGMELITCNATKCKQDNCRSLRQLNV